MTLFAARCSCIIWMKNKLSSRCGKCATRPVSSHWSTISPAVGSAGWPRTSARAFLRVRKRSTSTQSCRWKALFGRGGTCSGSKSRLGWGHGSRSLPIPLSAAMEPGMSVPATLSLKSAAGRIWDAVVVGAGPAGSMAARELARRGVSVLLVDRAQFPRFKVCGGCLNPRSLRLLRQAGLGDLPAKLGAVPITGLKLASRGRFARVRLPAGAGVSRDAFDAAMIEAAISSGAAFLPGTAASLLSATSTDARVLCDCAATDITARSLHASYSVQTGWAERWSMHRKHMRRI